MRTPLVIGLIGVCLAGVAIAAPVVPKGGDQNQAQNQGQSCPAPSFAQCTSEAYLASACGKSRTGACTALVEDKLKTFHEATEAPAYKMLRPGRHQLPDDLRQGKYFKYAGPQTDIMQRANHQIGRTRIAGLSLPRMQRVAASDAAKVHRNPAWEANGQKITSCEEYGYEWMYDVARFIDASAACKGDQDCVFDVAFMDQTPGLADRTLRRKDGKLFGPPGVGFEMQSYAGILPKNEILAAGPEFVRSHGATPLASTPQLTALETAMTTGATYYRTDCKSGCNDRKFASEWKWHKALRQTTANLSPAEFEEYERRKAKFRRLLSSWNAAVSAELAQIPEEQARVFPFDARTRDPLERLDIIQRYIRDARVQEQLFRQKATPLQLKQALGEVKSPAQQGGQGMQGARAPGLPTAWLAAPAPKVDKPAAPSSSTQAGAAALARARVADPHTDLALGRASGAPTMIANPCVGYEDWGSELLKRGPISCEIGQFLRVEWQRKQDGKKSCLDLGSRDCDWTPEMLSARFLDRLPSVSWQDYFEEECRTWTGGTLTNKNSLDEVTAYIEEMKQVVGAAKRELQAYERPGGKGYARSWDDREVMGDKKWFGAEYHYDLGFEVDVVKRSNNKVCELGGGFHAAAGFDAYMINSTIKVVDAELSSDLNKAGDHKSKVRSHLTVLGDSLYAVDTNSTLVSVFESQQYELPPGFRPSFTVPAGPIPITGAAWGELLYGAGLELTATVPACNVNNPNFAITAAFVPTIMANAHAQVGVGISGVVSAGIRGALNLVTLSLPFKLGLKTGTQQIANETQPVLSFDMNLVMTLGTLAGRLSLYIEFLLYEQEWELFRWRGVGPAELKLMPPVKVSLPLVGMQ
ncbi:MAG: hypothetical protein IPO88_02700 [Nannocystis sp.]|uniref:hypothetical protein n=1 Tax=Nannocystis sp. TaxID=1962667 RepID=UPI0024225370|nr:hypothetical protein [Nannocystis sp.]MBK9752412.1 hypothetical protein [Nannocystis sp.]